MEISDFSGLGRIARPALLAGLLCVGYGCSLAGVSMAREAGPARLDADHTAAERIAPANAARRVIEAALALVPGGGDHDVALIDPEFTADPAAVRRLDAFTVREPDGRLRQKIYINVRSSLVRGASEGNDFYVKVLAAVIVHEIEHLKGGSEARARRAERQFFEALVARSLVDPADGERYLDVLRQRAGDRR
jgi:hypothetical protein